MNCNDIPQYEINRIFLNLYTEEERNQQLDTKLKMLFESDEDAIRMYRLNMALNRIWENERIRLQLLAQRRALFAKRKRKSKFKVHESKFYKSFLPQDKIDLLLNEGTREAKRFRRKFRVPYSIFMEIVDEISNSNDDTWNCLKT